MKTEKILAPTDLSEASREALKYATVFARDTGARLIIAYVHEPATAFTAGEPPAAAAVIDDESLKHRLAEIKPSDPDVPYEHRFLLGDPVHQICECADEEGVDMIVMGTHGRTGLSRLLMGSVAEAVVRRAHCPVLTVKPKKAPQHESHEGDSTDE